MPRRKHLVLTLAAAFALAACGAPAEDNQPRVPKTKLNIYNWSDYVDPGTVEEFEKDNHVEVHSDYYDSNEALEAKVLTGKSGYDLVVPSLSNIGRQIQAGAYQPIQKDLLPEYRNIDPYLLKMISKVDPDNRYTVPYFWGVNTIGINKAQVTKALGGKLPDNLWDLVFNPTYTKKLHQCGISFLDSPVEQFPLVLNYIGKDPNSQDPKDYELAAQTLRRVRGDIRRFSSSSYIDDLANGNLCVVIGYNGDINIAKKRAREAKNGVDIEVLLPKEGVGVWVDAFAIPKDAANVENAHKYINHTLKPYIAARNGNFVTFAPASKPARALMDATYAVDLSIFPSQETLNRSFVILPQDDNIKRVSTRLWQGIRLKSSQ